MPVLLSTIFKYSSLYGRLDLQMMEFPEALAKRRLQQHDFDVGHFETFPEYYLSVFVSDFVTNTTGLAT